MKVRESVLCKMFGGLVLVHVEPTSGKGSCPQCGFMEFEPSKWSGPSWTACANQDCNFEVLTAHVKEAEAITTKVSKGDCKP